MFILEKPAATCYLAILFGAALALTSSSNAVERSAAQQQSTTSETVRTWSDSSGKYQIQGSFVRYANGSVTIRKPDGSEISVPLERLSESDGKYVRLKLRSKRPAALKPDTTLVLTEEDKRRRDAADELVRKAIIADLNGQASARNQMLAKAVDTDPEFGPARWLSGQIRSSQNSASETWLSVEQAEQLAADDPVLIEYARRRSDASDDAKSQEALALWCRKQGLEEQEQIHWRRVLTHDLNHRAARRCLQLQEHNGRLLTREQIAEAKQQAVVLEQKRKEWMPKLNGWRKAIQSNDVAAAGEARREMSNLRDPDLVGLLESYLSPRSEKLSNAVVEALANMPEQTATDSLVRHAVRSQWSGVRRAAAERLKDRPKYSYVPLLINAMSAPLEFSSWMNGSDIGYMILQEGKSIDYVLNGTVEIRAIPTSYDNQRETDQARSTEAAENAKRSRAKEVARDLENYVQRKNQAAEELNEPIRQALEIATGEDLGLDPIQWNDWWNSFNENEVSANKPVVYSRKHDLAYAEYTPVQGAVRRQESGIQRPDFAGGWTKFMEGQTARMFNQSEGPAAAGDFQRDLLTEANRQGEETRRFQEARIAERKRQQEEAARENERRRKEWESKNPEEAARQKEALSRLVAEKREESRRRSAEQLARRETESAVRREAALEERRQMREEQSRVRQAALEERRARQARRAANPHECFPAGTLVRTQSGQRPIEEIRIGDLVLAQNPDSGELTYKPVVRTTVRPADKLLEIRIGGEILRTTKGHPMWVGGQGWRIAKYVQAGDRLHRYFGSIEVEAVREVPAKESVYNLVVDEFHSYFVGENSVMVHDNSVITPPSVTLLGEKPVTK